MHSPEEPDTPRGRGLSMFLIVAALVVGAAAWYVTSRPTTPPDARADRSASVPAREATRGNAPTGTTERPAAEPAGTKGGTRPGADVRPRPTPGPAPTPAAPVAPPRELRVTSDIPGAYVFLDRTYLGTTPLVSRDVTAGPHQVNVQVEGRPPVVRTVEIPESGPAEVVVTLAAPAPSAPPAIDASVAVVHQHAMGSCEGTLRASPAGFRYDTPHKDAFSVPYGAVEQFGVDYTAKRLRLKQRGGRTWNFTTTAATADPLFVFHRDVDAVRPR